MTRREVSLVVPAGEQRRVVDLLAEATDLPKARIKDAMQKGAAWLGKGKGFKRIRRASAAARPGDTLSLYYDARVLAQEPAAPACLADRGDYSVWIKPAGMLSSGSRWGDHCALPRWVEMNDPGRRPVYLVHRLDREARGLMLLAHGRRMAAALSGLFQERAMVKCYRVKVRGRILADGRVDLPLDGKPAGTAYRVLDYDETADLTRLEVNIETGRKHQIRRHLAALGHPVVGDRLYGGDRDAPLDLEATGLSFQCPIEGRVVTYSVDGAADLNAGRTDRS